MSSYYVHYPSFLEEKDNIIYFAFENIETQPGEKLIAQGHTNGKKRTEFKI